MTYQLRPARPTDKDSLAPWTTHTFAWGDYVVDSFDDWLIQSNSLVLVAADDTDAPVAVARGVLLSPDELWLQGVRVHPEWRRLGIASDLGIKLQQWGSDHGAKVALLMTEDWNAAARDQVSAVGFRETAGWVRAFKATSHSGHGVPAESRRRLRRASMGEASPAYMAWARSELARAGRRMLSISWQWRRLRPDDLERAAEHGALWSGPTGWAIAAPRDGTLEVGWMHTTESSAADHVAALAVVAEAESAGSIEIMVPAVTWLVEELEAAGFETESLLLHEKSL